MVMKKLFPFLFTLLISVFVGVYNAHAKLLRNSSTGDVWPKPLSQKDTGRYFSINPNNFTIVAVNQNCSLLEEAIERYTTIIRNSSQGYIKAPQTEVVSNIQQLSVNLTGTCETLPHLDMDESYYVWGDGRILANSVWGILRGLETLSQLIVPMPNGMLRIPETEIYDRPRFKYRGVMLDCARSFISTKTIFLFLEGMAYNKLNAFHWHLADEIAFPFNSTLYPELSKMGAYAPEFTYSSNDIHQVVEFARKRGIRVIPEFDALAHTDSWGLSHPEIQRDCVDISKYKSNPLDLIKNETFNFLYNFFSEIRSLFPDDYLHLGGDEVSLDCWEYDPAVSNFLNSKDIESNVLSYLYLKRFSSYITKLGWKQMMWHEAMSDYPQMSWPPGVIAQVWRLYALKADDLTSRNFDVILTDGWYLDPSEVWENFYLIDPTGFNWTKKQKAHVIGGEAGLWTENIEEYEVLSIAFPLVSAMAERLWSEAIHRSTETAKPRIEEHNCRMLYRGVKDNNSNRC